jgi:hypothetical protein
MRNKITSDHTGMPRLENLTAGAQKTWTLLPHPVKPWECPSIAYEKKIDKVQFIFITPQRRWGAHEKVFGKTCS